MQVQQAREAQLRRISFSKLPVTNKHSGAETGLEMQDNPLSIHIDSTSGKKFAYDRTTGSSVWLEDDEETISDSGSGEEAPAVALKHDEEALSFIPHLPTGPVLDEHTITETLREAGWAVYAWKICNIKGQRWIEVTAAESSYTGYLNLDSGCVYTERPSGWTKGMLNAYEKKI